MTVQFLSDITVVVAALLSKSARDPILSHLLRCLFFFEAHFQFCHVAGHIPGRLNLAADAISRNKISDFLSVFPQALPSLSMVPLPLQELVLDNALDWTSWHWSGLFRDILSMV